MSFSHRRPKVGLKSFLVPSGVELATGISELKDLALRTSSGIKTMVLPGHKEVEQTVQGRLTLLP